MSLIKLIDVSIESLALQNAKRPYRIELTQSFAKQLLDELHDLQMHDMNTGRKTEPGDFIYNGCQVHIVDGTHTYFSIKGHG